jgi:ferredoxin-NADP reductase/predicted pyridoxine 5'-phosphate oxidase superfamily flavin-nucleotide-binding protein
MSRAYTDIAFTPSVRAMQTRMGSRTSYAPLDQTDDRRDHLGVLETEFIEARDSFYQATVGETGWPYVQFRGGPKGFLKVLDEKTIGYADFRGNVQYISVGNLADNNRVSIILMDYANRRRLKIFGRARLIDLADEPTILARLESPHYRARIERAVIIAVEGYDWNCPQHITPRFTESEISAAHAPIYAELARLKSQINQRAKPTSLSDLTAPLAIGSGPLPLIITGIRQLTPRIRAYELRSPDGALLPAITPGAHIDVPVRTGDVSRSSASGHGTRRYSITNASDLNSQYEIAVQLDPQGRGGSIALHRDYQLGVLLHCAMPGNDFALHADDRPAILIAGGIGITPLCAMAQVLIKKSRRVTLHYAARSRHHGIWLDSLQEALGDSLATYFSDEHKKLDVTVIFREALPGSVFYVCGPPSLIEAARAAAREAGVAKSQLRFEAFKHAAREDGDKPFKIILKLSEKVMDVDASQSILDVVESAGIAIPAACRIGQCGTCSVKVVEGTPDHRDVALSPVEREQASVMCICVSRAISSTLTLDL